jgi:hypothetical protein
MAKHTEWRIICRQRRPVRWLCNGQTSIMVKRIFCRRRRLRRQQQQQLMATQKDDGSPSCDERPKWSNPKWSNPKWSNPRWSIRRGLTRGGQTRSGQIQSGQTERGRVSLKGRAVKVVKQAAELVKSACCAVRRCGQMKESVEPTSLKWSNVRFPSPSWRPSRRTYLHTQLALIPIG